MLTRFQSARSTKKFSQMPKIREANEEEKKNSSYNLSSLYSREYRPQPPAIKIPSSLLKLPRNNRELSRPSNVFAKEQRSRSSSGSITNYRSSSSLNLARSSSAVCSQFCCSLGGGVIACTHLYLHTHTHESRGRELLLS